MWVLPSNATFFSPKQTLQSDAAVQQAKTSEKLDGQKQSSRVANSEEKRYRKTVMEKTLITYISRICVLDRGPIKKAFCTYLSAGEAGSSLALKLSTATRCDQASKYIITQVARSKAACVMSGAVWRLRHQSALRPKHACTTEPRSPCRPARPRLARTSVRR